MSLEGLPRGGLGVVVRLQGEVVAVEELADSVVEGGGDGRDCVEPVSDAVDLVRVEGGEG